jgi:hypothetical protein
VLCRLSRDHGIDWALSHDPDISQIRAGVCDENTLAQIEALDELGDILSEFRLE